jgi:glucose-6-phosphate 1-dehydrogenase
VSTSIQIAAVPSLQPPRTGKLEHGDSCTLVLFGATGDLAKRKLIGAIYDLERKGLIPATFRVLGVDREPMTDEAFRTLARSALDESDEVKNISDDIWRNFGQRFFYAGADLTTLEGHQAIAKKLGEIEAHSAGEPNRLFYLSVPPVIFEPIVRNLAKSGLAPKTASWRDRPWRRVIIEKPFGTSLETAKALSGLVLGAFNEHQVYRIDHYLGKETVQNILVFRAANAMFEPVWNRTHISHVEITAAETVGVEQRARYYEHAGVVRDMFQNHLLQLVALTAMELPHTMDANAVRDEKVKVLRAVRPLLKTGEPQAIRAQYAAGIAGGKPVAGYRDEPGVDHASVTPTYAALQLNIDTGRWRDVPFYVRSGKRMAKRVSEIAVHFRVPPYLIEGLCGHSSDKPVEPNVLVLRVQPDDGVTVRFQAKIPGAALALTPEIEVASVDMNFNYADAFGAETHPAYETLLLDCMIGDATLFTRSDEVEVGWKITDPLLQYWEAHPPAVMPTYAAGQWGPQEADMLLARNGHSWRKP